MKLIPFCFDGVPAKYMKPLGDCLGLDLRPFPPLLRQLTVDRRQDVAGCKEHGPFTIGWVGYQIWAAAIVQTHNEPFYHCDYWVVSDVQSATGDGSETFSFALVGRGISRVGGVEAAYERKIGARFKVVDDNDAGLSASVRFYSDRQSSHDDKRTITLVVPPEAVMSHLHRLASGCFVPDDALPPFDGTPSRPCEIQIMVAICNFVLGDYNAVADETSTLIVGHQLNNDDSGSE